jgi:hypothetical protein
VNPSPVANAEPQPSARESALPGPEARVEAAAAAGRALPRAAPLRVLHVEDSEDDHALVLAQLHRSGVRVSVTRVDTLQAFELALSQNWDAIVCDYNLPWRCCAPAAT